jgi:hypothetical protein
MIQSIKIELLILQLSTIKNAFNAFNAFKSF